MAKRIMFLLREWKIIKNLAVRNVKVKYKDTWLGFVWVIMQPLCTIGILYFVFSQVFALRIEKFPLFLCAGVLPWTFFANSLVEGTSSLVTNSNLALKVNFPLEILPLSYCLSNMVDFCFSLVVLVPVLWCCEVTVPLVLIPVLIYVMLCHCMFVIGLTYIFSIMHVFFKDIGHLLSVVLMFWFYLTPIFYSMEQVPGELSGYYAFNPMVYFVEAYRAALFYGKNISFPSCVILFLLGSCSLCVGWIIFVVKEKEMVKEL